MKSKECDDLSKTLSKVWEDNNSLRDQAYLYEREKQDLLGANETLKRVLEQNERDLMIERDQRKNDTYLFEDRLKL